jgi:Spondin_N
MKTPVFVLGAAALLSSVPAFAASYKVEIQNLTQGIYFAPLVVATHSADAVLFKAGMPASMSLQKLAEGADNTGLVGDLTTAGAMIMQNPAGGLLAPGAKAMVDLGMQDMAHAQLSIIGMIVPSNDGFVTLHKLNLPTVPGTYTYMVNAYDAGTEANDEIRGGGAPGVPGLPVPPPLDAKVGTGGTGIVGAAVEGFVHIHRGVIGDTSMTGGGSDLNSASQRWLNPVGRVTVTVE